MSKQVEKIKSIYRAMLWKNHFST